MASLRQNNIEHLADVRIARMEGDGEISVIARQVGGHRGQG